MRRIATLMAALLVLSASPGRADHTLWAWGHNELGQLGLGYFSATYGVTVPTEVTFFKDNRLTVTYIGSGWYHTIARTSEGGLWAWGRNFYGELGLGLFSSSSPYGVATPTELTFFKNNGLTVTDVRLGGYHTFVQTSDGSLWAWGYNFNGELGLGYNTTDSPRGIATPTEVTFFRNNGLVVTDVWAGDYHSLARTSDGRLWAWGSNSHGELGLGTNISHNTPTEITFFTCNGLAVTDLWPGPFHTFARTSDGRFWAWGWNYYGQLGLGDTNNRNAPTEVTFFHMNGLSVSDVAVGAYHTLARTADGRLWAWGGNSYGELGLADNVHRSIPTQVTFFRDNRLDVTYLSTGGLHTLARTSNGALWAWGYNYYGQLGLGDTSNRNTPSEVMIPNASYIVARGYYTLAIARENTIPVAGSQTVTTTSGVGKPITLTGSDEDGDPLTFYILSGPTHGVLAGAPPNVVYTSEPDFSGEDSFTFVVSDGYAYSAPATVTIMVRKNPTKTLSTDRTGTISETVTLRGYCYRKGDNLPLTGKTLEFRVDGTFLGTAVTGSNGRADFNWIISDGPTTRTIGVSFPGDEDYEPSSGTATLTCQSWTTKMASFDRTQRITGRTELKARLVRSDNTPLYNKQIKFYVDGTFIIARPTNTQGYASYPYYDVPDGAGAGTRTILSEWPGNGGYAAISKTATLTVLKAIPYIWVQPRSMPQGGVYRLYCYFRRLYDYKPQGGKTLAFSIDGTWVADVVTADTGVARFNYSTSGLSKGDHTARCTFAGDAWVDGGFGEARLTIY